MTSNEVKRTVQQWLHRHQGIITRTEVLDLGGTDRFIRSQLDDGTWTRRHRGVFVVAGIPVTPYQEVVAAIAAAGPGAQVSHLSAAWMWRLVEKAPATIHLTVPDNRWLQLGGVACHRSRLIPEAVLERGVPCTNPARTLIDIAGAATQATLADLMDRALTSQLVTLRQLHEAASPALDRPLRGKVALRRCLEDRGLLGGPAPSVLESKAARLFRRHRLPMDQAELVTGPDGEYRLDFVASDCPLAVEVDGYMWHFSPEHQRRDQARRNRLTQAGWTLLIYTWRDILEEANRVATEIADSYRRLQR